MSTMSMIQTDELFERFQKRTLMHIDFVNKYSKKKGILFPEHDSDKFTILKDGYKWSALEDRTPEQEAALSKACKMHITSNRHHPEFWTTDELNIDRLSSRSVQLRKCIEAHKMPKMAIFEMCCDWCAMSEELGNTPHEWADKQIGVRWDFTKEQIDLIYEYLDFLWK